MQLITISRSRTKVPTEGGAPPALQHRANEVSACCKAVANEVSDERRAGRVSSANEVSARSSPARSECGAPPDAHPSNWFSDIY